MPGDAIVEVGDAVADRGVQFRQTEEAPVAEPGDDPAFDQQHADLDFGLVAGFVGTRRHDRGVVMGGEIGIGAVDRRLEEAGLGDAGFEIVRDDLRRHAAEERQSPAMGCRPVGQRLCQCRLGIGVAGGAEHGDEHLGCMHFAGQAVDEGDRLAGIVDEHPLAGRMGLAHARRQALLPALVALAELAVAIAVRMNGPVLFPKQQQRHRRLGQFAVDRRPVRQRPRPRSRSSRGRKQALLQHRVRHAVRQRPNDAGAFGAPEDVAHRRASDPQAGRDLPCRQTGRREP